MSERVTAEEFRVLTGQAKAPKVSKYRNKPMTVDGLRFDSKREAHRWLQLKMEEKAGRITKLRRQVPFSLSVNGEHIGKLILDFVYHRGDRVVFEDVKCEATITPIFKWKAKHFLAQYGFEVEVVG